MTNTTSVNDPHESVTPFTISVPEAVLEDLRARLQKTRWAADLDNTDESYGLSTSYLRDLVEQVPKDATPEMRAAILRVQSTYTSHVAVAPSGRLSLPTYGSTKSSARARLAFGVGPS